MDVPTLQAQRGDVRRGAGAVPRCGRHAGAGRHLRALAGADGGRADGQGPAARRSRRTCAPRSRPKRCRTWPKVAPRSTTRRSPRRPVHLRDCDVVMLAQFSMAAARARCAGRVERSRAQQPRLRRAGAAKANRPCLRPASISSRCGAFSRRPWSAWACRRPTPPSWAT